MANPKLEVLTPQNTQVIFIDHQPQMAFGVHSSDRQTLKSTAQALEHDPSTTTDGLIASNGVAFTGNVNAAPEANFQEGKLPGNWLTRTILLGAVSVNPMFCP